MLQIVNGSEMFLANQYFDDRLISIKQQDRSFSTTEKKYSNHSKHMKGFSITRGSNICSITPDTFWVKDFVSSNLEITFNLGLVK